MGWPSMELIMLCGIPTAGKSTFSNKSKYKKYVRISSDDVLTAIAKEKGSTYNAVFQKNIKFALKTMDKVLRNAIEDGKDILWDQTNLTAQQRMGKLRLIPSEYTKIAVWFAIPLQEALQRNTQREGKVIPPDVLERMYREFEIPSLKEGFDQVIHGNN